MTQYEYEAIHRDYVQLSARVRSLVSQLYTVNRLLADAASRWEEASRIAEKANLESRKSKAAAERKKE